jgi:hypothetical protein
MTTNDERLAGFVFSADGQIFDSHGLQICMFGVVDFEHFWTAFDAMSASPLGRKLIYAAADAEETSLVRSDLTSSSWFQARKTTRRIHHRNLVMGWGVIDDRSIRFPAHDALGVGVALAQQEQRTKQRWKVQWDQKSADFIALDFTPQGRDISPLNDVTPPSWGCGLRGSPARAGPVTELDFREYGFFFGQQRSFFLPVSVFDRLYVALSGRPFNPLFSLTVATETGPVPDDRLFQAVAAASKSMFDRSDVPVFVLQPGDWEDVLQQRVSAYGLGTVEVLHAEVEGDFETVFRVVSPLPAYTCGLLHGIWERCFGQRTEPEVLVSNRHVVFTARKLGLDY